jgi:hypothetical protein
LELKRGKGRSFLIQTTLDAAVFSMFNGKKVMMAAPMSPTLTKQLNWVRELCQIQNRMIKKYIRRKGLKGKVAWKPFLPNLVQAVVGPADKNYKRHDDTGPETCVCSSMCTDLGRSSSPVTQPRFYHLITNNR